MDKTKVLYFVNYPFRMTGANQVLFNLLQSRRNESVVIFMFAGPVVSHFATSGISVITLDYQPRWIGSFGKKIFKIKWYEIFTGLIPEIFILSYKLFRVTSRKEFRNYRVVHFNDTRGLLTAGWFFKVFRYNIVTHIHGEFDANNVKGMRWRLAKVLSDRFITVSNYLRERMDEAGRKKAVNIYNGLDDLSGPTVITHLTQLRKRNIRVFLKVASVVPFKGVHVLIEAVRLLRDDARARSIFVIVGPEPEEYDEYQRFLRSEISRYELEDFFIFVGWQNDLLPYYNSSDALIHSSMSEGTLTYGARTIKIQGNEGLPTCILEAMRNSLPIIACSISGVPEQVEDHINGLLVEPNQPRQLATAIEKWLTYTREEIYLYKRKSRDLFLNRFQLSNFVDSVEEVYHGVQS